MIHVVGNASEMYLKNSFLIIGVVGQQDLSSS